MTTANYTKLLRRVWNAALAIPLPLTGKVLSVDEVIN
jgi:hypothetical protein